MERQRRVIRRKSPEEAKRSLCIAALQRAALLTSRERPTQEQLDESQRKLDSRALALYNITNGKLDKESNALVDEDEDEG